MIHVSFLGGVVDGYVAVDTLGCEAWEAFEVPVVDCSYQCWPDGREEAGMVELCELGGVLTFVEAVG